MNPKRPALNEHGERLLKRALQILPGLLASGHFTTDGGDDDEPSVLGWKVDPDDFPYTVRGWCTYAVQEALNLAEALEDEAWERTADDAEADTFFEAREAEREATRQRLAAKKAAIASAPTA